MHHVIGLLARAGHGKTTIAKYLEEYYGVSTFSLASPLKKIAKAVMDFSDDQLYGTQAQKEAIDPRYGFSARIFLQKLGTEGIRQQLGELAFCESLATRIGDHADALMRSNPLQIKEIVYSIDDARFPNEVGFINDLDLRPVYKGSTLAGHVIKIVCTDAPPSGNDNHPSERGIDEVRASDLSATVVSSRAQGIEHLIREFENALSSTPALMGLRGALNRRAGRR